MFRFIQTAPEVIVENFASANSGTVHAVLNGLQMGDPGAATLCKPDKHLAGEWTDKARVTCGNCKSQILKAQGEALALNEAYNQGVVDAEVETELLGDTTYDFLNYSDQALADARTYHAKHVGRFLTQEVTAWRNRLTCVTYHAKRLTMVNAEIARRKLVHDVAAAEAEAWELHKLIDFAEKLSSRPPMPLAEAEQLYAGEQTSMPTENNYGEQGPFHFTDHPHDQIRALRYDLTCDQLLEMVAQQNQPVPSTERLVEAILGLEHGEAIQEDSARFPHVSFTRFAIPLGVNHRLDDGTVERVWMVGSDVSRRIYPQNMVLITRDNGMAQVVPEGTLTN